MYIAPMAHVLIIDDNPWNSEVAQLLLQRAGHEVSMATDATEGLAIARREMPNLILMDLNLPGMDGLTATRQLKQDPAIRDITVYAYTPVDPGANYTTPAAEILASGCAGVIAKNTSRAEFLIAIERALSYASVK